MRLSLLCVPSCGHSLHSDLTALLGDSLQASKKYLATLCCLLSTLWMFRHYKEVWLIELRCLLERQIFFKKNFDNKDWLVNVVLRTSHQACIYNVWCWSYWWGFCGLEERNSLYKNDFLLLPVFSTIPEINIKHRHAFKNKPQKSILYCLTLAWLPILGIWMVLDVMSHHKSYQPALLWWLLCLPS